MGNYFSNARSVLCMTLIAVAGILSSNARQLARPGGYLVKTGPSPLRFQAPCGPMNLPPLPEERHVSVQTSTNSLPEPASNIPVSTPIPPTPEPIYDPSSNSSQPVEITPPVNPPPAANDLLSITPQMLADYFKSGSTNAAHVNMFGPVYFMPPMAPMPSSSATYKTQ